MIQLFNVPKYRVDSSRFSNLLHDPVRDRVEQRIAEYVGADYCVALGSCTDAIFLSLQSIGQGVVCTVPTLVTSRFLGAIVHSHNEYVFTDDADWVGHEYVLYQNSNMKIIDSAQRLDPLQFEEYEDNDLLLLSVYPTKPLGGLKGGFVVSNDKERIEWIRQAAYFGEQFSTESWNSTPGFIGWQKYMNSVEAYFVERSLDIYQKKRDKMDIVRYQYKENLSNIVTADSYHLFRIRVDDNRGFLTKMVAKGIVCGIHYTCCHSDSVYGSGGRYLRSERDAETVVSIPFHDALTQQQVSKVIKEIHSYEA